MKTFEMMNIAKDTDKKFKTEDLYYTYKDGFTDKIGKQWSGRAFTYINKLFEIDDWEEVKEPVTWQEAIEAWEQGKSFSIKCDGKTYFQKFNHKLGCLYIENSFNVTTNGIDHRLFKHGKWYIED